MNLKKSLILFSAILFLLSGCEKNSKASKEFFTVASNESSKTYSTQGKQLLQMTKDASGKVSYESFSQFFKPDYSAEFPDEINHQEEKSRPDKNLKATKPSDSVVPGIRKNLSDYKTVYNTQYKDPPKVKDTVLPADNPKENNDESTPFKIEDWGPQRTIVATNEHPSFYVIFNKPAKPLTALEAPSSTSDIMTITPALKGVFRWYGTQHLSFEASEPANPSISYQIKINPKMTSVAGQTITGQTTFTTTAEPLKILKIFPGYEKKNKNHYSSSTGALPTYENKFLLRVNYKVSADKIKNDLIVTVANRNSRFTVEPNYEDDNFYYDYTPMSDKNKQVTNTFVITITDVVPHNVLVTAALKNNSNTQSYKTLLPFSLKKVDQIADFSKGKMSNPLTLYFSQVPDKKSLVNNISFNFDYKITEDNINISGTEVTLFNLPLKTDTTYTLYLGTGIKDIFGQTCYCPKSNYEFKTRGAPAYVKFIDYGNKLLEAQFPHKLIFEYQNIQPDSFYRVFNVENPFYFPKYDDIEHNYTTSTRMLLKKRNARQFEEINFDNYLDGGYGFIRFQALVRTQYVSWDKTLQTRDNNNQMTIQVTDLGVTARIGLNRAVFMVRDLRTGKPVPSATVHVLTDISDYSGDPLNHSIAKSTTNKNGLAVINFTEEQIHKIENDGRYYYDSLYLCVQNNKDKVIYRPNTHSSWREGVYDSYMKNARKPVQRTFMFVDRGLYKPGEIVTFRGIDRDQYLGQMVPYQGNYTVNSKGNWWHSDYILSKPEVGKVSESGGFYGSFKLPDELDSGSYILEYTRDNGDKATVSFTVATFERVKFESSLTVPQNTYYGGDKLDAELYAAYLAGGALTNANYNVSWYKQPRVFNPNTPETKNFRFGPSDYYSDRDYFSYSEGSLDNNGTATITCNTEKITNGRPHLYRAEAYVTDVSNQRISTQTSVLIHSSSYYFGIKRPRNISGFAKVGKKLEFPFVLCDTNGNLLNSKQINTQVKELKYTLTREVWNVINEQSVDDYVYTRYEKEDKLDSQGAIVPQGSGVLDITPSACGWYTLKVTGFDENNNNVVTTYEFYVTGGRSYWYNSNNSNSIKLTPDQSEYNPGDTAEILVESPLPEGDYLITVEREGIFTEQIQHFDSPASVIKVPIATNYVPVVYVSISSYSMRTEAPKHKYGEVDMDKPKGYYGVTPVFINPYVKAFSIKVECDKSSYKPGETAKVKLTATKGGEPLKNAELTLMAVDRGVLDLINYHVPDPISYFYSTSNFPLRVSGGDSRDFLMDPVTYSIKDLQGGDSEDATKENERKDFRPTAVFEPVLMTDKNGVATCTFKMPDSLTTYRITAFGVKDDKFALQEEEVKVQNPVNIQQVQPRKLRVRDTAECGVLITNLNDKGINVTVDLQVRSPTKNTAQDELEGRNTVPGKGFVDGPSKHQVYVAPNESTVVYFDVCATEVGTVELVYNIHSEVLDEKLISPIQIEKTYVYETVTMMGQTTDKKSDKVTEFIAIPDWAKDGRGDLKFTLDTTRLGMLGSSVNYLFEYPYGCMEQQSARVLPLIVFGEYIDAFDLNSRVSDPKKCVISFTKNWKKIQKIDGGFPYWPDGDKSNYFVSTRIAEIYAYGLQRGYTKNELGYDINKLKNYLVNNFYSKDISIYEKAHALYVLNMLKDTRCNSALSSYGDVSNQYSLTTNAYIALAYLAEGSTESVLKAKNIATDIRSYLIPDLRSITISKKLNRSYNWYWYDNQIDEISLILQLLVSINPNDQFVDKLIFRLLSEQSKGYWTNTSSSAKALEAIYTFIKQRNLDNLDLTATVDINNKNIMKESFKGVAAKPKTLKLPFEDEILKSIPRGKQIPLTFSKEGTGTLYYTTEMKYALPDEMQRWRDEGIDVEYTITDYKTGNVINTEGSNATNSLITLESGKTYKAQIYVSSKRQRDYVAIRCPIPSGAEILDSTFITSGSEAQVSSSKNSYWRYYSSKNIKDNEVQYFYNNFYSGGTYITFTFRATRRGVYPTPPVMAECMYEPEVFGRSNGYLFVIK